MNLACLEHLHFFPPQCSSANPLRRLISFTETVIKGREKGLTPQMAATSCKWALIMRGGRFHSSRRHSPFTPLGKHSAGVTSPKDIYMADLPPLSNLVFLVHGCTDCPLGFILKEFDNLIWVCVGKGATLCELLDRPVIFGSFIIPGARAPDPRIGKQSLWKWHQVPAAVFPSIFKALTHFRVDFSLTGELLASASLRGKHRS